MLLLPACGADSPAAHDLSTTSTAVNAPTSTSPRPAGSTPGSSVVDNVPAETAAPLPTAAGDTTVTSSVSATLSASDVEEITGAFTVFFGGGSSTVDEKVAVLEDGERYRSMLEAASANEQFHAMSTAVHAVRAGSPAECARLGADPGCAVVTHDLLVSGFPMAAAIESPAVRGPRGWLVGWRAWCATVEIGGASCPERAGAGS